MVLSIDQWVGKLAVVTGASAGIGAAISKKLVECGIHVTIYLFYLKAINRCFFQVIGLARRPEKVEEISKTLVNPKGRLYALKCDITIEDDVKLAFKKIEQIGPIHILINNAGTLTQSLLYNGEVAEWKKVLGEKL